MKTNKLNWNTSLSLPSGAVLALAGLMTVSAPSLAQDAEQLIRDRCLDCLNRPAALR